MKNYYADANKRTMEPSLRKSDGNGQIGHVLRKVPQSTTITTLHWPPEAREGGGDQEHHGQGQLRASLKPCSSHGDQSRSWPR